MKAGRLVIVSNRVAMPNEHRAGGLAVAMRAALKEHGGMWFGWSGKRTKDASGTLHTLENGNTTYCTMDLSVEDFDHYYITRDEIVFIHDFGYPHVVLGIQPDGEIHFRRAAFRGHGFNQFIQ